MPFMESESTHRANALQAPCIEIRRDNGAICVTATLDEAVADHITALLSSGQMLFTAALSAVNSNTEALAARKTEAIRGRERRLAKARRLRTTRSVNRRIRRECPSPAVLAEILSDACLALAVDQHSIVGILALERRRCRKRLEKMRQAHACRWKNEGRTGAEIGERLGITPQAANKLVRAARLKGNRVFRAAA